MNRQQGAPAASQAVSETQEARRNQHLEQKLEHRRMPDAERGGGVFAPAERVAFLLAGKLDLRLPV